MNILWENVGLTTEKSEIADVFIWDNQFETGVVEIDDQHRKLVQLINGLGRILALETDVDALVRSLLAVFDELADYVEYHFRFEEDLMARFHCDHKHEIAHKQAHADFIREITEARAEANEHPAKVTSNTLTYLSKWLMTHIVGTDMRMAKEMLAVQSGLSEDEARKQAGEFMGNATEALLHAMNRLYDGLARRTQDLLEAKRSLDQEVAVRKEVEAQLRKLSRAVEYSPVSIIITNAKGEFEYVNPKFTQLSGYALEDLKGQTPRILKSGNTPRDTYQDMWVSLNAGREWRGELQNRKKSGELYWDFAAISPVFDADGFITHYVSIQEDITERRMAEQALHEQKRFSEDIVNSLPGIFYMLDVSSRFVRVNPRCMEVTGYTWDELQRMTALDFFGDENRDLIALKMRDVLERGDAAAEAELVVKSGRKIPYYFTGHRTIIDGRPYLVGIGTDITERHALEQELAHQAKTDALTGLPNRRHFIEQAELELARAKRYDKLLSVLMLDLDEFKAINDSHGHQAGDMALYRVGQACRERLREVDVIGRIGGEEFAILLPETDARRAVEVAERLRQDIAATVINLSEGRKFHITASIGVATLTAKDADVDRLLNLADKAMYRAKRDGRNKVRIASDA